jgi:arylformamidase
MMEYSRIIDISRPINSKSACFPGDVPFSRSVTLTYAQSSIVNLTSFTMSPHVGTHADAPSHIKGDLDDATSNVESLSLELFVGACRVFDLAPFKGGISIEMMDEQLNASGPLPRRILLRTQLQVDPTSFESDGAYLTPNLVHELARLGVRMIGIDTASVDNCDSKLLEAHHALDKLNMAWLENLDLSAVKAGDYFLMAAPLRFSDLEASPVRALLLE